MLTFKCPSCGSKLRGVPIMDHATQVVQRTCPYRGCRETWQLVVRALKVRDGFRLDQATFVFKGRKKQ